MTSPTFAPRPPQPGRLRKLIGTISLGLCKLNEIQFEAPWNARRQGC